MSRLRWLTSGESHGPRLVAIVEGVPAGLPLAAEDIDVDLARRQRGYGRGARMKIETDRVVFLSGVRGGETLGSPLALTIEVNGLRVEAKGEVRGAYPNLGMVIFFTTTSGEDRERLRELLESLSRPSVMLGQRASARPQPTPKPESFSSVSNPTAVVKALTDFFAEREMLSRDEFLRILRRIQSLAT